jgi:tetratricopeptide (TPR) repeat protein
MFAAVRNKDTLELKKAFDTSVKYYNMPLTWEQYILASYELKSKTTEELNVLLDTAIKKFPGEDFNKTKAIINSGGVVVPNTTNFAILGVQSYQKGKYAQAAEYYKKAIEVEPNNYTHYENVAICLYTVQKYDACIPYFEKASQFKENNTGKSEFFKAMALISIGKKDQACSSLQAAQVKGGIGIDTREFRIIERAKIILTTSLILCEIII